MSYKMKCTTSNSSSIGDSKLSEINLPQEIQLLQIELEKAYLKGSSSSVAKVNSEESRPIVDEKWCIEFNNAYFIKVEFNLMLDDVKKFRINKKNLKRLKMITQVARQKSDINLLLNSAMFDTRWYLDTYDDVKKSNANPVLHYLAFGNLEGRDPSSMFNTSRYLTLNPDVKNCNMNALVHYLKFGSSEGRRT